MTDENVTDEVELNPLDEPVEPAQPADGEASTETTAESSPAVDEQEEHKTDAVQARINKITAEKYEARRKAEELERRLAEIEKSQSALPSEAPKLEDFDYDESRHTEAVIQYQVQKQLETQAEQQRKQAADAAVQAKVAEFATKESEYAAANPTYAQDVANLPRFNQDTLDAIYSLDNGPQMAQYLGRHLDVADEIASSSPVLAAVKLGQIAATLSANAKTITTSKAPEPVDTLSGAAGVGKDLDSMSMDEIMAL